MWIARPIEKLIVQSAARRPVLVVLGARQVGKTALVQRLFPRHGYVSLELPSEAEQAEQDPYSFLRRNPPPLVVDEVQFAPQLVRHVREVVDRERQRPGQFILTGTPALTLERDALATLAPLADILVLEGLSWSEIRQARPETTMEQALLRGGFPQLYARPDTEPGGFHRSYLAAYLARGAEHGLQVTHRGDLERFIRGCAMRTGQLLNKAEVAREVGISGSTAGQWLAMVEAAGLVSLVSPWSASEYRCLVKTPKSYVCDTGLAAFLMGLRTEDDLRHSPLIGPLWETMVGAELRRLQTLHAGAWQLHFWRDRTKEADFLVHRDGRFVLADARWVEQPTRRDADALRKVAAEFPRERIGRCAIVCRCVRAHPLGDAIDAVPLDGLSDVLVKNRF